MTSGVVTVGRHRYAVGLYWENSPGGGRVAQIAKEAASQPGQQADFFVVRPGNKNGRIPQFGLCSNEAGQKAGMPVLAGCLAGQIPGSWAGAFRLKEGIVLTIVRDDLIVPDGDLFFSDETEARDRLLQEIGFGGLQSIYAPEAWSIPGADTIPLTLLINDQTDIKLQRVSIPQKTKLIVGGGIAAFVLLLLIGWVVEQKISEERDLREAQEQALLRAQRAALPNFMQNQEPPPPKYERVWEQAPPAMVIINACKDVLTKVPAAWSGWKLSNLRCTPGSASLSWSRERGPSTPPPQSNVNDSGSVASQAFPLTGLTPRGPQDLENPSYITERYLAQDWQGTLMRMQDDPPPPPPPDYHGPWNPPPPPWVKRSFTLTVPELPAGLPITIGDLPGVVVNSMTYAGGSGWTVEGVIYENRK